MTSHIDDVQVVHNEEASQFEAMVQDLRSELSYARDGNRILFTHTGVPPALRGRGIASKMARAAMEYVRENNLVAVPLCSYMVSYIRRHPEYQSLVQRR
ncbi:MAG TPA: GNAT family N-acetyltransferase [Roseiflexaceae bacterium]|jgi:predicted GNAT family acetyltransferase|nr:GNAT family N-acetyltransferase [Roseiflexaceae bacterium]